jgi:pfkB family carbohydrate kinase
LGIARKPTLEESLDSLAPRIPLVVVKCGARGVVQQRKKRDWVPSLRVESVDTIGTGDSFNAGFLNFYVKDETLRAAAMGNVTGALSNCSPVAQKPTVILHSAMASLINIRLHKSSFPEFKFSFPDLEVNIFRIVELLLFDLAKTMKDRLLVSSISAIDPKSLWLPKPGDGPVERPQTSVLQ